MPVLRADADREAGMPKKVPPQEKPMPFVTGGDWSVGMNTGTSLQQAEILTVLGRGLQKLYGDVVEEGVPEHLAQYVEKLETRNDPEAT
jgi:hypothetical protein